MPLYLRYSQYHASQKPTLAYGFDTICRDIQFVYLFVYYFIKCMQLKSYGTIIYMSGETGHRELQCE